MSLIYVLLVDVFCCSFVLLHSKNSNIRATGFRVGKQFNFLKNVVSESLVRAPASDNILCMG